MSGCSPAPLAEPGMPSFDVVELRSSQPGDCDGEEREEQGEPESSLRHGEADWLNPLGSVSDYIAK